MAARRYYCKKLKNPAIAEEYKLRLKGHLQTHNTAQQLDVEGEWLSLRQLIAYTVQETLGYVTIKHRNWFDDQDQKNSQLVEHKRKTRLSYENHSTPERKQLYMEARRTCQVQIRELQNNWWQWRAEELQSCADRNYMKSFLAATKELYGPRNWYPDKLWNATSDAIITNPSEVLDRWRKHFESLLNEHYHTEDDLLRRVPQILQRDWMHVPPTIEELKRVLCTLGINKSPGPVNLPIELLTGGGEELLQAMFRLITNIWTTGVVPADFRDSQIIAIYKKEDRTDHRGSSPRHCRQMLCTHAA